MRATLLEKMKSEIERNLKYFLREEGIEFYVGANDNMAGSLPYIELEHISDSPLEGSDLLSEIKIILGILGKPWQCGKLVEGLYEALQPHHITQRELAVLLMSLHVEATHCVRPRCLKKRAVMRYIVEESPIAANDESLVPDIADAECC